MPSKHAEALENFRIASTATSEWRSRALNDLKFKSGIQWDSAAQAERSGRPTLVINKMGQFVRQITNEQRQNPTAIKISPVDDNSDPEVAKVMQGIIRHIEYASGAEAAYETAFEHCVIMGKGWWRIITEYADEESFDQVIRIKRIMNPFTVYEDPAALEADYSDMKYCFVSEKISHKQHEREFPGKSIAGLQDFTAIGDDMKDWAESGQVRTAEYYYQEIKEFELVEATVVYPDSGPYTIVLPKKELPELEDGLEWDIVARRTVEKKIIKKLVLNGSEILDESEWPVEWIPIIPVLGDEIILDGKRDYRGIIRDAIDSQRMNNYWVSKITEVIAQTPNVPWVGPTGAFKGHEEKWKNANKKPTSYLEYNPSSHAGKPLSPPSRGGIEAPIQAMTTARAQAADDLEAVVGIHAPSLGKRTRGDSGKAIIALQEESNTANFHYVDNLTRAHRQTGRILVALIPIIYDTPRMERIVGVDGDESRARLTNQPGQPAVQRDANDKKIFNVGTGLYDVICETGPAFATKRKESVDSLLQLTKVYPTIMEIAPDIMVKNMDTPFADELADRLKRSLRPDLIEDDNEPIPAAAANKIQQLTEQMEQMQSYVKEMETKAAELEDVLGKKQIEADTKIKVESMRIDLAKYEAELKMIMADNQITSQERIDFARGGRELDAKLAAAAAKPNGSGGQPNVGG